MVSKACFQEIGGFDEELCAAEWLDLCMRLAERYEFDTIDQFVEVHHDSPGPHLWTSDNRVKAIPFLLRKYNGGTPHSRYFRSRLTLYSGVAHLQQGRSREARSEIWRAFSLYPSAKILGYLFMSLVGAGGYRGLKSMIRTSLFGQRLASKRPKR